MSLTDIFNESGAWADNSFILQVRYSQAANYTYIAYDFLNRIMVTRSYGSDAGISTLPFSALDREVLEAAHETLKRLKPGGTVPDLPAVEKTIADFGKPGFSSKGVT